MKRDVQPELRSRELQGFAGVHGCDVGGNGLPPPAAALILRIVFARDHHLLRARTFFLVRQIEPRLRVSAMNPDWLKKYLQRNPAAIRHEVVDGRIVLTAATRELQAFLLEQATTQDAFGKPADMVRRPAAMPGK